MHPDVQGPNSGRDPYDFLTAPLPDSGKGMAPGDKKRRIIVVAIGGSILLMLIIVIFSLVVGSGPSNKVELLNLAKQQNELIRVAEIGAQKSREAQAKNLAVITKLSLTTDQQPLINALKAQQLKIGPNDLAGGKNPKTDEALTAAEQANRFDEVFLETMQSQLTIYQKALKQAYNNPATGKKLKATLDTQYRNASLIINVKPEI